MERRAKGAAPKKLRLMEEEAYEEVVGSDSELSSSSSSDAKSSSTTLSKDALAKIPGVKKQARYVPAVSMSKEELTMWRKEARRVRNRESAAASRQKTQKRITELEHEVGTITKKYEAALRRIVELEAAAVSGSSAWKPSKTTLPLHEYGYEQTSPVLRATSHTVSPPLSPRDSFSLYEDNDSENHKTTTAAIYSNTTIPKISRHNACVKIPNRVVVAI